MINRVHIFLLKQNGFAIGGDQNGSKGMVSRSRRLDSGLISASQVLNHLRLGWITLFQDKMGIIDSKYHSLRENNQIFALYLTRSPL
jgi:hypothetical protein